MNLSGTLLTSRPFAANVCALCRSQKRKCDKAMPSCSRCQKLGIPCDYDFYLTELANSASSLPMRLSLALGQIWLPPVTLEALQPYQDNVQGRRIHVDQFAVQLIMTSLAKSRVPLQDVLSVYFFSLQSWLPVIHEKSFRSRVTQLRYAPRADTALLLLCMYVAAQGQGNSPENENAQHEAYYICKYLFSFLQIVQPPSLEMVQCGLLITVFEVGSVLSAAASVSIATCARLGYALGLHVDQQKDFGNISPAWVEAEERRRVWLGLFILDRLVMQAATNCRAPHVVGVPDPTFRLPGPDAIWDGPCELMRGEIPGATLATAVEMRVSYFAREVQASELLGQAQELINIHDSLELLEKLENLETKVLYMTKILFDQTPGSWVVFCGANSICLLTMILLQQGRMAEEAPILGSVDQRRSVDKGLLAVSSTINMICEICAKFNEVATSTEAKLVPLPAVICTGMAALAALQVNQPQENTSALKRTLELSCEKWKLARHYLKKLEVFEGKWQAAP
ncbi:putative Zn(II)2Cys6 transcription factor [Talaromyces proteolyticus]|uniref:Zn(II)2Cys6 transcription factor n=1 Tax=Talaromyces proteolyticus TaxID=1131652 RepID=A0AAD4PXG8_9EURO|nr:putative Zn(II)2Cys6 transcription factor [Talaromyces proteolyticus]KAH8692703.1 putative Zn(II)2Cys6 transcription factor [Talaromyces proteolyticus]